MRLKCSRKQSKVSRIDHSKALAAQADEAIRERIRTAPAYMYTSLCPDPAQRRAPKAVIEVRRRMSVMEITRTVEVQTVCLICRKRYPVGTKQCTCGGRLYVSGICRSNMKIDRRRE